MGETLEGEVRTIYGLLMGIDPNNLSPDQIHFDLFDVVESFVLTQRDPASRKISSKSLGLIDASSGGLLKEIAHLITITNRILFTIRNRELIGEDNIRFWLSCDVEEFIGTMKSAADSLCCILVNTSKQSGSMPTKCHDLAAWIKKYPERASRNITGLFSRDMCWFEEIRALRVALEHENAMVMIYFGEKEIFFDVARGIIRSVLAPEISPRVMMMPLPGKLKEYLVSFFTFMEASALAIYNEIIENRYVDDFGLYATCVAGVIIEEFKEFLRET